MTHSLINNKSGFIKNESYINNIIKAELRKALIEKKKTSLFMTANFNFFNGFKDILSDLKQLYKQNLLSSVKILIGGEAKVSIKEFKFLLNNDAIVLSEDDYIFLEVLFDKKIFEVRFFYEKKFNLKLFILSIDSVTRLWCGSADFTAEIPTETIELFTPIYLQQENDKKLYVDFFNNLWEEGKDSLLDISSIDLLKNASKSEVINLSPRKFISNLLMLLNKEYLVKNINFDLSHLSEFQNMSYYLCIEKLKNYGGAIFVNSVGMNKIYIASLIIKYYFELGKSILLIHAKDNINEWRYNIRKAGLKEQSINFISRNALQKKGISLDEYAGFDLIIVDRAEYFSIAKDTSNRLINLKKIIMNNNNADQLYISKKIVNDSLEDLLTITKLISVRKNSDLKTDFDILKKSIEENKLDENVTNTIMKVLNTFVVTIEWSSVLDYLDDDSLNIPIFKKPIITTVKYAYDHEIFMKLYEKLFPAICDLSLEYSKLCFSGYHYDPALIKWYKWNLYRKIDSSIYSFIETLKNILEKTYFVKNFLTDKTFDISTRLFTNEQVINMQHSFDTLPDEEKNSVLLNLDSDSRTIEALINSINNIRYLENRDDKITNLLKILKSENKPTIIFTECEETLHYIVRRLKDYGINNINYICGGDTTIEGEDKPNVAPFDISSVYNDFEAGNFDILITNDVIEEDIVFTRAETIINFDIPLNQLLLSKRDRRAITNDLTKKIRIYNFQPDKRIDKEALFQETLGATIIDIFSFYGLDYILWCQNEKSFNIYDTESLEKIIYSIKDYKEYLSKRNPDEIKYKFVPKMSNEDIVLREFIKYLNISDETLKITDLNFKKPIITSLKTDKTQSYYYVIYNLQGTIYCINELLYSPVRLKSNFDTDKLEQIHNLITEDIKNRGFSSSTGEKPEYSLLGIINYIED